MSRFHWVMVGVVACAICLVALATSWRNQIDQRPIQAKIIEPPERQNKSPPKERPVPEGFVKVGGVVRPESDVKPTRRVPKEEEGAGYSLPAPGTIPEISADTNPQTQSVAEAFQDPDLKYRLTSMLPAPDFDKERYLEDPDAYVNTIEPGRIWQAAKPGPDVVPIERVSGYYTEILQGEQVNLEVRTAPGAPTSFYSPMLGSFDNQLSTITVKADETGSARATFRATPGTRGEIEILASSPYHSGMARFLVKVRVPRTGSATK